MAVAAVAAAGMTEVARFGTCDTFANASANALRDWKYYAFRSPATRHCNHRFCDLSENLYLSDRCWNVRAHCTLHVTGTTTPLIVGQQNPEPANTILRPGQYAVALGPAATLGVASRRAFTDELRDIMPMVNLGRGGTGPADILEAMSRGGLTPLLSHAATVLIVLMAGRSSANSAYGKEVNAMARAAAVQRMEATDPVRALKLRNESLDAAASDYLAIATALREHASAKQVAPPDLVLLWFSECPLSRGGCQHPAAFPQFYTDAHRVRALAQKIGARLVDGSYGPGSGVAMPWPVPLDQCSACPVYASSRAYKVCGMDAARREMSTEGLAPQDLTEGRAPRANPNAHGVAELQIGCTQSCAYVMPSYYPHEAAHLMVAKALRPLVTASLERRRAIPMIDVDSPAAKIYFNHIHKCHGLVFTDFLKRVLRSPSAFCSHLIAPNQVQPAEWGTLANWWRAPKPNCTLVALEMPMLGELLTRLGMRPGGDAGAAWGWPPVPHPSEQLMSSVAPYGARYYLPQPAVLGESSSGGGVQLLTIFREPVARCKSHWLYDHRLCRSAHGRKHSSAFCNTFIRDYGPTNETRAHDAFAKDKCDEFITHELTRNGWPTSLGALELSANLVFVGISEEYEASLCLFFYQIGRFPSNACSCDAGSTLRHYLERNGHDFEARHIHIHAIEQELQAGNDDVPELKLSREALEARSPKDVALYKSARAQFEQRVRLVEQSVGRRFFTCDGQKKTRFWSGR